MARSLRQIVKIAGSNFRGWHKNPQIYLAFGLAFVFSFLLSDKVVVFAQQHNTVLQIIEPFIWTFGDAQSVLQVSLIFLLLFADMPNLKNEVPFYLIRSSRKVWLFGQVLYQFVASLVLLFFITISICVLAGRHSYTANMWSETAAILGYSNIGQKIAVPAFVKVLELTFPYNCMIHIFLLLAGYSFFMTMLMLYFNLLRAKAGMIAGIIFSVFGFLMTPDVINSISFLRGSGLNRANIIFGWISPLNHATYYMHNFGYDSLPRLWQSYIFFAAGGIIFLMLAMRKIKKYNFSFTGTQR